MVRSAQRAWTPWRARALDVMAGPDGIVVGVAVDHRDSLRAVLERKGISAPPDELLSAMKLRIVRALAPGATLVLADAEYAAAQAIAGHALPGGTALATPLEAQGYGDAAEGAATTLLEDWSPRAAAHLGATACKLLLPYRADEPAHAEAQEEVVRTALEACEEAGVALILEPIVYGSPQEDELAALVVEGASRLASLGPDVLKLQYPGSLAACRLLDEACGPEIPWVLLGGGADAKTLAGRIEDACRAGASGFVVGRTLWDAALVADADESERALEGLSVPMLERLAATARRHGRPWRDRVGPVESPQLGWYR